MTAVANASLPSTSMTVNSKTDAAYNASTDSCAGGPATCTLRAAVQVADSNGGANTITLPAGDYKLTLADTASGQTDNPEVGDLDVNSGVTLTLAGAGASSTTIDANDIDRAFAVQSGGNLAVSGVTVEHGAQPNAGQASADSVRPGDGGAFYNNGTLSISNSSLTDDSAYYGGAVYAGAAATSTSITSSIAIGNSSDSDGGFADIASGSVALSDDSVTHTEADSDGGVIYEDESGNTAGPLTITGSTVSDNQSDSNGGAIDLMNAGLLTITNSTFDSNSNDDSNGGAIDTDTGDIAVSGSTFEGNAGDEGGAIYVDGTSATAVESITTSTFSGNEALGSDGGAVYDDEGALTVSRSTFTENGAASEGGAVYYSSGDLLNLTNDTLDGNEANEGGGLYLSNTASTGTIRVLNDTIADNTGYEGGGIYEPENANTIENTIVADNGGGSSTDGGGDCNGTAATDNAASKDIGGNIDSDGSCFSGSVTGDHVDVNPELGTLANNGGLLETDALLTGSPAIGDAITSACPSTDQLGVTRPAACDSGAYQTTVQSLSIKDSGPSSATVGTPITYTLTVTNNGAGAATGVSVMDTLPSNVTYLGSTSSQGSCSGTATVTCSLGTINSTETGTSNTATVTITVIPTTAGSLSNSASVGATTTGSTTGTATPAATTVTAGAASGSGAAGSVTTAYVKPVTSTGTASKIRTTRAYLRALVNPAGQVTSYTIQVRRAGTSRWIGGQVRKLAAGTAVDHVAMTISHLRSAKRYSFRIEATNATGRSYGQVGSFRTAAAARR